MFRKQLVGVVTPADVSTKELREHLGSAFDPFIVPNLIFAVSELSMTTNGKVDLKALEATVSAHTSFETGNDDSAPSQANDTMETVSKAFSRVFHRPITQIVPTTSFRELGGNSLLAVKLMSHLRAHGLKIPMQRILELDTVCTTIKPSCTRVPKWTPRWTRKARSTPHLPITKSHSFKKQRGTRRVIV